MDKLILIFCLFFAFSCKNKEVTEFDSLKNYDLKNKEELLFSIGKTYFERECISCHKLNANGIGNLDFSFTHENFSVDFLVNFITKEDSLAKIENENVKKISDYFGDFYNHNYKFSEEETKSIIYYIKSIKKIQ